MAAPRDAAGDSPDRIGHESVHSIGDAVASVWRDCAGTVKEGLRLVAMEGRMAAVSMVHMLALALCAAIIAFTVWALLMGALAIWLTRAGLSLELALVAVAVVNVGFCAAAWFYVLHLSRNLTFAASRRQLFAAREEGRSIVQSHPETTA